MSRTSCLILLSLLLMPGYAETADKRNMTGKPPHASAYDGLLPAGMTPTPASGFHPSQLRGARVALVPSANFNEWARAWERRFDENGEKFKVREERFRGYEYSSNPRNFSERVTQALQPHVGEIFAAADLPEARQAGADYYLVVDGWLGTITRWNMYFHASGSVHLLDGNLQQLISAQGEAKVKYEEPSILQAGSMRQAFADNAERNSAQAIDEMSRQVVSGMQRHLAGSH